MINLIKKYFAKKEISNPKPFLMENVEEGTLNPREILSNSIERPSPEQALILKEEEIIEAAKELDYELYPESMEKIYKIQDAFLPIFEGGLISMLSEEEIKEPNYYAFARDGEMFFDALWGIGKAGEKNLKERIHYLKTSMGMWNDEDNSKYLEGIGITEKRFKKGHPIVFLDSGFRGSLFQTVAKWSGYKNYESLPENKNFKGYLMNSMSSFKEINLHGKTIKAEMKNSKYSGVCSENVNRAACAFMQVTPKFTGRYVQAYQKENGKWDVLPEQNSLISKLKINSNQNSKQISREEQTNSMDEKITFVNEDVVNPVASLLLQKRTLDYFSDPNVHDRVYSKIKKGK